MTESFATFARDYAAALDTHGGERVRALLSEADASYRERAEWFYAALRRYMEARQLTLEDITRTSATVRKSTIERALQFRRTGRYPDAAAGQAAAQATYGDHDGMRLKMLSLAFTQFLWRHHYRLYSFFVDAIEPLCDQIKSYLEVGPGHGLFLATAAKLLPEETTLSGVDLSAGSLEVTAELLKYLGLDRCTLQQEDATTLAPSRSYDFITAGELIEHLDDPKSFLEKLRRHVAPGGHVFVTTCANCPDGSHVYQFNDMPEIRVLLTSCGFEIRAECVAPSADVSIEEATRRRISTSYAALLAPR